MTRSELVDAVARSKPEFARDDVRLAVATILDDMSAAIAEGRRIELRGFGAFELRRSSPRGSPAIRRPGRSFKLPVRVKARFHPGTELLERVQK